MTELTITVNGMACPMCEAHINDAVRKAANVKKVSSSHRKNRTIVIAEDDVSQDDIANAIKAQGYDVGEIVRKPYEKRGLFGRK